MNNADCIFCKIIKRELPSDIVYENDNVIAFKDICPKAPVHLLIVPKEHIESMNSDSSEKIVEGLILAVKDIIKRDAIQGYKLVFNVGREGGQMVDHLHMHFLAGSQIELP